MVWTRLIAGLDTSAGPSGVNETPDGRYKLASWSGPTGLLMTRVALTGYPAGGKDSMKNDATLNGRRSVPPTILFSLVGNHPDVRKQCLRTSRPQGTHLPSRGDPSGARCQRAGVHAFRWRLQEE